MVVSTRHVFPSDVDEHMLLHLDAHTANLCTSLRALLDEALQEDPHAQDQAVRMLDKLDTYSRYVTASPLPGFGRRERSAACLLYTYTEGGRADLGHGRRLVRASSGGLDEAWLQSHKEPRCLGS